jgi:hypothetical protein
MVAFGQGVFGLGVFGVGAEGRRVKLTGVLAHSTTTGGLERSVSGSETRVGLSGAALARRPSGGRLQRGLGVS